MTPRHPWLKFGDGFSGGFPNRERVGNGVRANTDAERRGPLRGRTDGQVGEVTA